MIEKALARIEPGHAHVHARLLWVAPRILSQDRWMFECVSRKQHNINVMMKLAQRGAFETTGLHRGRYINRRERRERRNQRVEYFDAGRVPMIVNAFPSFSSFLL